MSLFPNSVFSAITKSETPTEASFGQNVTNLVFTWSTDAHRKGNYKSAVMGYSLVSFSPYLKEKEQMFIEAHKVLADNGISIETVKPYYEESPAIINKKHEEYMKANYAIEQMPAYDPLGDYQLMGLRKEYKESGEARFDSKGLPLIKYDDGFFYNPVTISQYSLTMYGRLMNKFNIEVSTQAMLNGADKLLELQNEQGAFPYNFRYHHYIQNSELQPGWVSSMAQGQAISALLRVYSYTGDPKYLKAADKSFEFMLTSVEEGGALDSTQDLFSKLGLENEGKIFLQEYVTTPKNYTLNGYMFTMLGVYDLSQSPSQYAETAGKCFTECNETLIEILRFYDMGKITTYDLGHLMKEIDPIINPPYHTIHIHLLQTLYSITNEPLYRYYALMWENYVTYHSS